MAYLTDKIETLEQYLPGDVIAIFVDQKITTILDLLAFMADKPTSDVKQFRDGLMDVATLNSTRRALVTQVNILPYWLFAEYPEHLPTAINDISPRRPLTIVAHFLRVAYGVPHEEICRAFSISKDELYKACSDQVRALRDNSDSNAPLPSEPGLYNAYQRLLQAGSFDEIAKLAEYLIGRLYSSPPRARIMDEIGASASGDLPEYGYAFSIELFRNAIAFVAMGPTLPESRLLVQLANTLTGASDEFKMACLDEMGGAPRKIALSLITERYTGKIEELAWESLAFAMRRTIAVPAQAS